MHSQADFVDGEVRFNPYTVNRIDMRKLQGAMFLDRPDLWRSPSRKRFKPTPPEQQPLFQTS